MTSTSGDPLELQLKVALRRLWHEIDTFEQNGSGWILNYIHDLNLHVYVYDPLKAGAHIDISKKLQGFRCMVADGGHSNFFNQKLNQNEKY